MLTRLIRIQLVLFTVVTAIVIVALGWYYLQVPTVVGIGQYTLYTDLPRSGGLYRTANVTYRGVTIGKVTGVEPTEHGVRATISIADQYRIPLDSLQTSTRSRPPASNTSTWCRPVIRESTSTTAKPSPEARCPVTSVHCWTR